MWGLGVVWEAREERVFGWEVLREVRDVLGLGDETIHPLKPSEQNHPTCALPATTDGIIPRIRFPVSLPSTN